ncbi:MAG: LacI family transcriptional regulator, partial [Rhodobacterales bacterium]|nr:LacI family transcriptional regulator [Rhodobacterales bacterium]
MKKNITIKDVAKETGVHVSTVSRALSPNARASLSSEVVERIKNKAAQMGYRPNLVASGLRTNRTMTVGIVIPDITNSLFPPIVRGVESVLEEAGYASILVNTDGDGKREERLLDLLLERGVDGIIDAAVTSQDKKVTSIYERVPIITANRMVFGSGIPAVINDDAAGIKKMFDLLVAKGHKNIGYIGGPERLSTGEIRNNAFKEASAIYDIESNAKNTVFAD